MTLKKDAGAAFTPGHKKEASKSELEKTQSATGSPARAIKCYSCGEVGHKSNQCRNKGSPLFPIRSLLPLFMSLLRHLLVQKLAQGGRATLVESIERFGRVADCI
jgi:hypothetical protein